MHFALRPNFERLALCLVTLRAIFLHTEKVFLYCVKENQKPACVFFVLAQRQLNPKSFRFLIHKFVVPQFEH